MYHYKAFSGTGEQQATHMQKFTDFYDQLHTLGYPRYSKNIAITNGAKEKLYPGTNSSLICDFEQEKNLSSTYWWYNTGQWAICGIDFWCMAISGQMGYRVTVEGYNNSNGAASGHIFYGSAYATFSQAGIVNISDLPTFFKTDNQVGFDNAPGGYHTALYDFNQNDENDTKPSTNEVNDPEYSKAIFMPTVTAFGIVPTSSNIYKTWDQIPLSETPFDVIQGMKDYGNEEHVRVSDKTSLWLQNDVLKPNRDNIQKPYPRTNGYTETESKA
jgi:hypothetical protein